MIEKIIETCLHVLNKSHSSILQLTFTRKFRNQKSFYQYIWLIKFPDQVYSDTLQIIDIYCPIFFRTKPIAILPKQINILRYFSRKSFINNFQFCWWWCLKKYSLEQLEGNYVVTIVITRICSQQIGLSLKFV